MTTRSTIHTQQLATLLLTLACARAQLRETALRRAHFQEVASMVH